MPCRLFFNDTATTEIYTLSLHDSLPIFDEDDQRQAEAVAVLDEEIRLLRGGGVDHATELARLVGDQADRSEDHTSEVQSQSNTGCRLLLAKKIGHTLQLRLPLTLSLVPG